METVTVVFIATTIINALIALKMNSRLNQVTELLDELDEQIDDTLEFDTPVEDGIKDACCIDESLFDNDEFIELEKRIDTLEKNTVSLIEELATLQNSVQGLAGYVNEVASFVDRLKGQVDQMSQNQ